MNKKEILSWLQQYGLAPNKMYGQHFLFHEKYIEVIVTAISPCSADVVLEIGPGLGVLTQRLSEHAKKVIAVEIDAGFVEVLQSRFANNSRVTIVHNDFLKTNPCHECTVLTGNLPYNIASQIIFAAAHNYTATHCFFLLQKEMAQRLIAKPKSAMYSAFTVGIGLYFTVQTLFDIPPQAFYPEPKVYSTFVKLTRKNTVMLHNDEKAVFEQLVATAFWARRKMLKTALKRSPYTTYSTAFIAQAFGQLGFDEKVRGEELTLDEFVALAKYCTHYSNK